MSVISNKYSALAATLHLLVCRMYFFLTQQTTGKRMTERAFGAQRTEHFTQLQVLTGEYVEQVNASCKEMLPHVEKLDMPNIHRLLELAMHTVPTYGHVKHVSDLLFENKHQILKRGVQRDRHPTNNEWAMYTDCMDFWKANVASIVDELLTPSTDRDRRNEFYRSFQDLLIGGHVDVEETEGSLWEELNKRFLAQLSPSLKNMLSKMETLRSHYIARNRRQWSLGMGSKSLAKILEKYDILRTNRANYLNLGDYFSNQDISGFVDLNDVFRFVLVFRRENGEVYSIALPCETHIILPPRLQRTRNYRSQEDENRIYIQVAKTPEVIPTTRFILVRMDSTFSRLAHYHFCEGDCTVFDTGQVEHAHLSLFGASSVLVQGRAHGFPPHAG